MGQFSNMPGGITAFGKRRALVVVSIAAASFGLGYWSRPLPRPISEDRESPTRTRSRDMSRSSNPDETVIPRGVRKASAAKVPRSDFYPQPFEPGESREWLLAQIKRSGWDDDPSTFFRMLQQYSAMDEASSSEAIATFQKIIRERQTASRAELATFQKEWLFKYGIFPALFRYSQLNPRAALDLIENDPMLKESDSYQVALSNLTALDPDQAIARADGLSGAELRNAMEPILGTLFSTDPDRVIRILEGLPQEEFDGERRKVAQRLAIQNPDKAIDFALTAIQQGNNPDIIDAAVGSWKKYDPEAAEKWFETYQGPRGEPRGQSIDRENIDRILNKSND